MKKQAESDLSVLPLGLLLGRLAWLFRRRLSEQLGDDIQDVRLLALLLSIRADPGGPQAKHAEYLGIDVNTARRLFDSGEAAGMLTRVPAPGDRRAHVLHLTPRGSRCAAAGEQAVTEVEAAFTAALGKSEAADFRVVAERLLCANDPAPPGS